MTPDNTERSSGGRRDDDFFAVERVGEPVDPPAYQPTPTPTPAPHPPQVAQSGWDVSPWQTGGPDASAGPASAPPPFSDGPVVGDVIGAPSPAASDPFAVSSTWTGPAPFAGGPDVDFGAPPRGAPDSFGAPQPGYGSAPSGYVEPTPPPRYPTERAPLQVDRPVSPDTGSVRIGDPGPAVGWSPQGPASGPPAGANPPTGNFLLPSVQPDRNPGLAGGVGGPGGDVGSAGSRGYLPPGQPDVGFPDVGGPPRPDPTGGFPRPYQTGGLPRPDQPGGFGRPAPGYGGRVDDVGPPNAPGSPGGPGTPGTLGGPGSGTVDPWNGHSTGSGPQLGSLLPPRQGPPTGGHARRPYPSSDGFPSRTGGQSRPESPRVDRGTPPPGADPYGTTGPPPDPYRLGGPGGYGVDTGPPGPAVVSGPGVGAAPTPSGAAPPPVRPALDAGPSRGGTGGHRPIGPGTTGGLPRPGAGATDGRGRASLQSGSWGGPAAGPGTTGGAGRPLGPDTSGSWRTPGGPDDPLSGPMPVQARAAAGGLAGGTRTEPDRAPRPAAPDRPEDTGSQPGPAGPWRGQPARPAADDTITTARPPFRGTTDLPALPPARSGGPGFDRRPGGADAAPAAGAGAGAGSETGPHGAAGVPGNAPGRGRRPESAVEMTSLVTRRGRGGSGADQAEDTGWQPSRSARRTSARGVPADRRRTPNPVTDTNSLQAVASPPARRSGRRPTEERDAAPTPGRASAARSGRAGGSTLDDEDLRQSRSRSAVRGAGRAARGAGDEESPAGRSRAGDTGPGGRGRDGRGRDGGGRDGGGRDGGGSGGDGGGPGREAGAGGRSAAARDRRATRAVGMLEPAALDDEPEAPPPAQDKFAWLRNGWIGPLGIALVVSLLVVGVYTMLADGDADPGAAAVPTPTATVTLVPTTREALEGKALVNGTWRCRQVVNGVTTQGDTLPDVFIVDATGLTYRWNDTPGAYTIAPTESDFSATKIGKVKFTSGPLAGLEVDAMVRTDSGRDGSAQGTLLLPPVQDQPARACYVN